MTGDDPTIADAARTAATFCATLVDEWARGGVSEAVVAPGSRSTPMAMALASDRRIRLHVHHDERSAGFLALGLAMASGRPAVVLTTSGTATAELHPAVAEAHHARVPMLVVTANRPPDLAGVGAPQTIDQTRLYGSAVRAFVAAGVPDGGARGTWRSLASGALLDAIGPPAGPLHLDVAFREPLLGDVSEVPDGRPDGGPWHRAAVAARRPAWWAEIAGTAAGWAAHGIVQAGGSTPGLALAATELAAALGWPVLADARVRLAIPAHGPGSDATVVSSADAIARTRPAALTPEVVVRLGDPPASRVVGEWIASADPLEVVVAGGFSDPARRASAVVVGDPVVSARELTRAIAAGEPVGPFRRAEPEWADSWRRAARAADGAVAATLATHAEPTEPGVARTVAEVLPVGAAFVVSSSMPIRDVEWYVAARSGVEGYANRGANGIDGVTSTAVGVALARTRPTVLLTGDVAFVHDSNGLLGSVARGVDLTIVVVDNDGGGIFSFLPQAAALPPERFEQLYGTPHGVDLAGLAAAHGVAALEAATAAEVRSAVAASVAAGGVRLVRVRTERRANVAVHDEIHAAVADALRASEC